MMTTNKHHYIREIEIRYKKKRVKSDLLISEPLTDPDRVCALFSDLQNEAKEKLIAISLDASMKILAFEVIAIGAVNSIYSRPIEVLRAAIPLNPYGLILVHNHPSGDPEPSAHDKEFTANLLINTTSLGINFCDHIIIGGDDFFSFAKNGLMDALKP